VAAQDGLALLKQMYQRGEITDEQYDTLRRHLLWGTPLPPLGDDVPEPRSGADPVGEYVPGAATVGPDRLRDPSRRPGAEPAAGYPLDPAQPAAPAPRRFASRRERHEAEEASASPPPPARLPPAASTGPLPPVGGAAPRRHHRRGDSPAPDAVDQEPAAHRHRRVAQAVAPDELTRPRAGRAAGIEPDGRGRAGRAAAGTKAERKPPKRPPRRRSVVAVLTSVVLALALAAAGVYWFELRRQGLPPAAYARQACGTVRDWQQAVDSSNARLIDQVSRQQDRTIIRSDVTAYYTTIAGRTDQLRTAILALGPADLTGGQEYADSLAAAVGDQAGELRRLAARAARLDPAAATFPTDLQGILTGADTAVSEVTAALARPAAGITTELRTTLSNDPACVPYVG
jgi:Short C-terminal domain